MGGGYVSLDDARGDGSIINLKNKVDYNIEIEIDIK